MQNEHQLLQSFCEGDYSSSESLIRQYEDNLYSLCCKLTMKYADADDLYQQTWLRAIQKSHTFSHQSFKNWLYTICINVFRDNYRKYKRREHINDTSLNGDAKDYVLNIATDNVSAESTAIKNLTKHRLMEKINALPNKHRIPIILYYFEDLDYKESAQTLGVPIGTIKSRLNYAKKKLRIEMEKEIHV